MFAADFIFRALIGGIGVAAVAAVLGCFVVWRRMAYFGDSLSHSGLLGVSLGVSAGLGVSVGAFLACALFAVILVYLERTKLLAVDTLLGILAHTALSAGVISISVLKQGAGLHSYLFGDILTITYDDIYRIYLGGLVVLALIYINWSDFILITIHEDLAASEGIPIFYKQLLLMFLLAIVISVSISVVGLLLITSMLIIPAAAARQLANRPETMMLTAAGLGALAVVLGLGASILLTTPSGPTVVIAATTVFITLLAYRMLRGN